MRITPEGDTLAEKRCAAQSEVADRILSTLTPEEVEERNQDVSNRFRASEWVLNQDYWRYLFGDNLPPDGEN